MSKNLSNYSVNIKELKKAPLKILNQAKGNAVAIIDDGEACAYLVPNTLYESMIETLDDIRLAKDVELILQSNETPVSIRIEEL